MHLDSFLLTGFSVSCNSLSTLEFSLKQAAPTTDLRDLNNFEMLA